MPTAVVAPELEDAEAAACPCGAPHGAQEAHAAASIDAAGSLADQLWMPWHLIVVNPLLTLAIYVVANAVYIALWWAVRSLISLLTLPGLLLLLMAGLVAATRRVASLLAFPGQLKLVTREGEATFARLTKRRVAMFVDAGQELVRSLHTPNQRMRFLQAVQNFEFAMDTLLRPLLQALELVDKESQRVETADSRDVDVPSFGVNSQLMLSLVREVAAMHRQEMLGPCAELHGSANAKDFEVKRLRLFTGTKARTKPAVDAVDDAVQPVLVRFVAQLQRLQNMLPLIGRPQSETRRDLTWLVKEIMCRYRKTKQLDSIATLDLMRADMTVRFRGEQVWIPSSDGFRVDAMLIPPQASSSSDADRRVIVICNPNGGLYEFHHLQMDWIHVYTSLGCHVLVYNYRGYGRNAGSPSPLDHNRDGLAIVHFLKTQRAMDKIAIHGESIGGLVATYVASKSKDVDVMIADRTFANVPALAQRMVASWAGVVVKWVMQWETDNCGNYLAATCAKLLCSDAGDEIIVDGASLKSGVALQLELGDTRFELPRQLKPKDVNNSELPLPVPSGAIFPLWLTSSPLCRLLPGVFGCGGRPTRRVSEAGSRPQLGRSLTETQVTRFSYAVLSIGQRAMQYTAQRDRRSDSDTSATVSSQEASSADSGNVHVSISLDGANHSPSSSMASVAPSDDDRGVSEEDHMLGDNPASDAGTTVRATLAGRVDASSTSTMTPNFPEELLAVVWMQLARLDGYCGQCLLQAAESGGHDRLRAFTASLLRWGGCLSPSKRKQLSVEPFERRGIWIVPLVLEDVHATLQQLVEQYPAIKFDVDIGFLVCMVEYLVDTLQQRWQKRDEDMEQRRRQKREERALKKQQEPATSAPVALASRVRAAVGGKRHAIAGGSALRLDDDEDLEDELPLLIQSFDARVGTLLPLQCGHNKNYLEPEKEALIGFLRQVGFLASGR